MASDILASDRGDDLPGPEASWSTVLLAVTLGIALSVSFLSDSLAGPWLPLLIMALALLVGLSAQAVRGIGLSLVVGLVGIGGLLLLGARPFDGWYLLVRELGFLIVWAGFPWLLGFAWQLRGKVRHQAAEAARQRRREQVENLRRERDAERIALAETLHDDLGHALSLVALNLGRLELDQSLSAETKASVGAARAQLGDAVLRLGDSVARLRSGAAPGTPRDPSLSEVLDGARTAGVELDVHTLPQPGALVPLEAVRVVREAFTNAAKHAPGQPVTVFVRADEGGTTVDISNPLPTRAAPAAQGSGTGLAALAQRLQETGGHLEINDTGQRFSLTARVPAHPDAVVDSCDPPTDHQILASGRRRGRMIITAAVLAVLMALGLVETLLIQETTRAHLPAEDFAAISVGDTEEATRELLPDRELRPTPGEGCHDYAVTPNTFDDASGDVYRVCFADGLVTGINYVGSEDR
ncbi:hypothetical protein NYP18_00140 [Corynebacterium sp. YIM 101645]|uniref:histidine kinase n=1 Tax=Corynebacterium lemuris TaxID=1859292 RepID=A0ABT2FS71_9CORY|nr:hypothetical protein [Corynebacterium lemuris]MCS5478062.1 hypothetical protein [Corynebacterium lemuris]